ncbi:MAG TPA: hypothetical protein VNF74_16215 [Terriglobales bacterium]|nr:hypothetical protein [Terriglobales bacterium]
MFDLVYLATHPLARAISERCAELEDKIDGLPAGSGQRRAMEKRLERLELYHLPKPTPAEQAKMPIYEGDLSWGAPGAPPPPPGARIIGHRSSPRQRLRAARRGRPEVNTIKARAALEKKIANPRLRWPDIAQQVEMDAGDLKRAVRHLRATLRREGLWPSAELKRQSAAAGAALLIAGPKTETYTALVGRPRNSTPKSRPRR